MKSVLKILLLLLMITVWLPACSPSLRSVSTQPTLIFQPDGPGSVLPAPVSADPVPAKITVMFLPATTSQSAVLVQEIQALAAQRRADLVPSVIGWLHLIVRRVPAKAGNLSPSDSPAEQIQLEQWLALDEQGRVRANIQRVLDNPGPQAGELTWLSGGDWTSLPLAGFSQTSSTLPFDPNYGIDQLAVHLAGQGQTLTKSTLYKECWYQGEKYIFSDGQTIHEVLFMPYNHALRWIKTWQISAQGITLVESLEVALAERLPQPPDEILNLAGALK